MRVVAFIFARGGSKGLPKKNILPLDGVPLVCHSIMIAKKLSRVVDVFVSTDDEEIKSVAMEYGAKIIDRPAHLATDEVSEWKAWQHAVNHVQELGLDFDVFLSLPATAPLRNELDVNMVLDAVCDDFDIVLTATSSARSPYFNMVNCKDNGEAQLLVSSGEFSRRQDVPAVYDLTTVAYAGKPNFIIRQSRIFDGRVKAVIVPKERALDIDDEIDFKIAQLLIQDSKGD